VSGLGGMQDVFFTTEQFQNHKCDWLADLSTATIFLANSGPPHPGGGKTLENMEEIGIFYCLALKTGKKCGGGRGRNKDVWPKYLPL